MSIPRTLKTSWIVPNISFHGSRRCANGTLSNEKEWLATTTEADRREFAMNNRGVLAHKYDIRFHIPGSSSDQVTEVTKTYPETAENRQEITNSLGWSLGGKVTGSAACGSDRECEGKVGIELSGGVKANVTTKFEVKDVKVENRSADGHPGWVYTIRLPEMDTAYIFWWYFYPLTFPTEISTSTFQPQMTWVWKISDSLRDKYPKGLPIAVEFQPELAHCYSGEFKVGPVLGWKKGYFKDSFKPEKPFSVQVSLPWPPTKASTNRSS